MPSRLRVWRAAAAAFIVINLGGGIYAAATGEAMHAAVHVVLLGLGIAAYSGLRRRRAAGEALPTETAERLKHLEQSEWSESEKRNDIRPRFWMKKPKPRPRRRPQTQPRKRKVEKRWKDVDQYFCDNLLADDPILTSALEATRA